MGTNELAVRESRTTILIDLSYVISHVTSVEVQCRALRSGSQYQFNSGLRLMFKGST